MVLAFLLAICVSVAVAVWWLRARGRRRLAGPSFAAPAETDLTQKARGFFGKNGWETNPSGQCSFIALRNGVFIYVLTGDHLTNVLHAPNERNFLIKVIDIKLRNSERRPLVLALLEKRESAEIYERLARGKAAVLAWDDIALVNELVPNRAAEAGKTLSDWAVAAIASEAALCVRHGLAAMRREDMADARAWAERAVLADPTYAAGHLLLSAVYLAARELDPAEASAKKAFDLDPGSGAVVRRLSEVANARGQDEKALELIGKAIAIDGYDPLSFHFLALLRMKQGDLVAAAAAARNAVALDGKNVAFRSRLEKIDALKGAT